MTARVLPVLLLTWPGLWLAGDVAGCTSPTGFQLPPGFCISEYADDSLAHDIYTLACDARGRVLAAGRGYLRVVWDEDGDGRADRTSDFASAPADGAMGLLWEGETIYAVGDGGLWRFEDRDGDLRADGPAQRLWTCKTGGEHDAHCIRRGPEGWLYLLCGNTTGLPDATGCLPTSPIQRPVAGYVIRFRPDFSGWEILADGFRNPYGMDFDAEGQLFTCDSDNERCVSLPWYEPVRFYHVLSGRHYGWRTPQVGTFWRMPSYFPDLVRPVCTLGRGSPTGVVCYRHSQFPPHYRQGFFVLDWTFGRIHFLKPVAHGASYVAQPEVFLQAIGDNGFAPTGCVVHPITGDLLVSVGGRGTRGAIYRVTYQGQAGAPPEPADIPGQVLRRSPSGDAAALSAQAASDDPRERLAALQAIRRLGSEVPGDLLSQVILANANHPDQYVRLAASDLLPLLSPQRRRQLVEQSADALAKATLLLGGALGDPGDRFRLAAEVLTRPDAASPARLVCLRAMQEALGGIGAREAAGTVWEGYTPRKPLSRAAAATVWVDLFPTGQPEVDWELARTCALLELEDRQLLMRIADQLTPDSTPEADIHYLIVLSRLPGQRPAQVTDRTAWALLHLDRKLDARQANRDRHWPLRVAELHSRLAEKDPALNHRILSDPSFGRGQHLVLTSAPGFDRATAARKFLARATTDADFVWLPGHLRLLHELDDEEIRPVLSGLSSRPDLRDALVPLLARAPRSGDRALLLDALTSPDPEVVSLAATALARLPVEEPQRLVLQVLRCWRSWEGVRLPEPLKNCLHQLLEKTTGQKLPPVLSAWEGWVRTAYLSEAGRLAPDAPIDLRRWDERLARLDWSQGRPEAGKAVFQRLGCAACHSGGLALGPDLRGVTERFSRNDLFRAILQPSENVPPRYQTVLVETHDGRVYRGSIIYEAADGLLLLTGPGTTIRLAAQEIHLRKPSLVSLMPAGLLDRASDQDLADLYAYLKALSRTAGPAVPQQTSTQP